ncbi:unnamed protein product [Diamesa hyperborea]
MSITGSFKWIKLWKTLLCGSFLLSLFHGQLFVVGDGNIGCLFVDQLCIPQYEWCYDDFAFGKCLQHFETDPEKLYREPLSDEQTFILRQMLQELHGAGLDWDHPFTQCRLQNAIYALRSLTMMEKDVCSHLAPPPIVPKYLDPTNPLAFVRFTQPVSEFADETFYPPLRKKSFDDRTSRHQIQQQQPEESGINAISPEQYAFLQQEFMLPESEDEMEPIMEQQMENILENSDDMSNRISDIKNRIELHRMMAEYDQANRKAQKPNYYEVVNEDAEEENNEDYQDAQPEYFQQDLKRTGSYFKEREEDSEKLQELLEELRDENIVVDLDDPEKSTSFREVAQAEHIPKQNKYQMVEDLNTNFFDNKNDKHQRGFDYEDTEPNNLGTVYLSNRDHTASYRDSNQQGSDGVYTEGGLVYVPDPSRNQATSILQSLMGFTRHERLDVKKPGPPPQPPPSSQSPHEAPTMSSNFEILPAHFDSEELPKMKKQIHSDVDHANFSVDTEYAHVILKNPLDNWKDGARIVQALGEMLNLQNYFTHTRVDRHEVSFKVEANPEKKTAADVAKSINDSRFKNNLSRRLGVLVSRAGIGDKVKDYENLISSTKMETADDGPNVTRVMIYMIAGAGVSAVLVVSITLYLIHRHDQKKDKLGGLQTGLTAAETCSKDYQELCRARMAGKTNPESSTGRIASLTKENDRPPSSRSSTSSWSEEPALSNMDISTGHMVLSYMEDHLRNKGRLQREWQALEQYEAEPGAREAALQPECSTLNRIGAPLPFDHSRVVLNHLANAEGMDYINASTITDHDPRAPAYVAAQAPSKTTLAHFWQMVWEQGCVVLVALCRLEENGETNCQRYWPEEGAAVYHIYEVHLVSEHIWNDDYLVRSFYLKNLQTGETRTVTQFHFLSWPQNGVPQSAKALLEFRRKVNKSYRGRSCPIVVHSSNGGGRTGAYILLDLVLGRMNKGAREIDIAATLEHLRDQRSGLVETRQQFEFVLTAVAEEVHAILKALPQSQSTEKRELDKETVKEQENQKENEKPADKPANEK